MKIPNKLGSGDTIGILSTARKITKEEINPAILLFESWGLKVCLGDFLFEEFHLLGYFRAVHLFLPFDSFLNRALRQ